MATVRKCTNEVDGFNLVREEEEIYFTRTTRKLPRTKRKPKLIDLFCGAGGMTLGFSKLCGHAFKPVWAVDDNPWAAKTYEKNFGAHCSVDDIIEILEKQREIIPKADVVIGGPPCQGFSLLNKNRRDDHRKQLWRPFLEVVELAEADIFVMENVPQLLNTHEHMEIIRSAEKLGFTTYSTKLCAADYGAPQVRYRAFIVGCRFAPPAAVFPPKKTRYNPNGRYQRELNLEESEYIPNPEAWKTVRDAISDLPEPEGTEIRETEKHLRLHFGRSPTPKSIKRYHAIPEEGMNRFDLERIAPEITPGCWKRKKSGGTDLFGRLWWDRPAFTIRTEFFKPEKGRYLHPEQHRPITHLEAARFQTFPDEFIFEGSKIEIAKQIGNAVPPVLASRVADAVYALWLSKP